MLEDCVGKIIKASNGELSPKEAKDIMAEVLKAKDFGKTEFELIDEVLKVNDPKSKEGKKLLDKYNLVRERVTRKAAESVIESRVAEAAADTLLGKIFTHMGWDTPKSRVREGMLNYVRTLESYNQVIKNAYENNLEGSLQRAGLLDYAHSAVDDIDIIKEQHHLSSGGNRSVTGNSKAFEVAQIYNKLNDQLLTHKKLNGSSVAKRKGFITSNMWFDAKVSKISQEEFIDDFMKIESSRENGITRPDVMKLRERVNSGRPLLDDPDAALDADSGSLDRGVNIAKRSGLSRTFQLTAEEYARLAPKYFHGETLFERMNLQIRRDSSTISQLETLGPNPRAQLKRIMENMMRKTPDAVDGNGKHALDNEFFFGKNGDGDLIKSLFGDLENPADLQLAGISELFRDIKAFSSLMGAGITAMADDVNTALRSKLLSGDGDHLEIASNMFNQYKLQVQQFGKVAADAQLKAEAAGITTLFNRLHALGNRLDNPDAVSLLEGALGKVKRAVRKGSRLNGLEDLTNLKLRANYVQVSSLTHSFRGSGFENLPTELRILFQESQVTPKEWDFIRSHAATSDKHGNQLLTVEKLNSLEDNIFKELSPDVISSTGLKRQKQLLANKWNAVLWREARTGVLLPDVVDKARTSFGTQRGTPLGEVVRQGMLFKSFSFGMTARIMVPLLKRAKVLTVAETSASLIMMGMAINWTKDILAGRSPRDYRKPENTVGLVAFAAGLPYIDQLSFALTSDNPSASNLADIPFGPVGGDLLDTTARVIRMGQDIAKGKDPEIAKEIARTFLPLSPTKNYPIVSIGHNLLYNNLMEFLSPGHKDRARRLAEKRGQLDYTL